jgi:hypothetical protein
LNGVFSSTYDNYLIDMRFQNDGGNQADVRVRFRASGSDNTTASSYVYQMLSADSTTVAGARTTTDYAVIAASGTANRDGMEAFIYGSALAQPTAGRSVNVYGRDGARMYDYAFTHNQSTAYDGFTLFPSGGTLAGLIKVYGLVQ